MVFNFRDSFSSSGRSEEPEVVRSDLIEKLFSQPCFFWYPKKGESRISRNFHIPNTDLTVKKMVFNVRASFFSSGRSEEPEVVRSEEPEVIRSEGTEVVRSDLIEKCLFLRSSLLRLNGRCCSEKDWFLVCPFVSDSNVDDATLLELGDWLSRKQVALGVARGLIHLRGKVRSQIQSILLIHTGKEFVGIPGVLGSFKEYPQLLEEKVLGEGDVRRYGAMLLGLITGEKPPFLLALVTLDGMNPKCCAAMGALRLPLNFIKEEAEQLAHLAFCCAFGYPDPIVSMSEVVKTFEQVVCSADLLTSFPAPTDDQNSKSYSSSTPYHPLIPRGGLGRD